jgi:hypothetical protein
MDNINLENAAKTESNKEKLLLYVVPSQKNSGTNTYEEKDQRWESSLSRRAMIVAGGALISMNIILITLASLKVFGIINSL